MAICRRSSGLRIARRVDERAVQSTLCSIGFCPKLRERGVERFGLKRIGEERFGHFAARRLERFAARSQHRVVALPDSAHGPAVERLGAMGRMAVPDPLASPNADEKDVQHHTDPKERSESSYAHGSSSADRSAPRASVESAS